ncbi:MAG TPA: DUF3014 domain-containing protein [Rhodanobacteraceae bacterium]|nr:DUF3014 domain-containing protein [Rhodanobacteraceae bacterium]
MRSAAQWVAIIVLLVIIAIAIWFFVFDRPGPKGPSPSVLNPPATASTAPAYPINRASVPPSGASAALPDLHNSDAQVMQELLALPGLQGLRDLIVQQAIIPNIVATVDALPRQTFGSTRILPLRTPQGAFAVEQQNGRTIIGPQNYQRYAPYMQVLKSVDDKALVAWYVHNYPLFQQAYRELGYPKGYFNDRLIATIDNLIATPEPTQPIEVKKSGAFYVYADSQLESLSAGQKMLLHTGPENEKQIKIKLQDLRALLVGQKMPAPSGSLAPSGQVGVAPKSTVTPADKGPAPAPAGTH